MNLEAINDVRGGLESGLAASINLDLSTYTRLNALDLQKDTPRIEVTVDIGPATGARKAFPEEQVTRYVRWNIAVAFKAITRPAEPNTLHAELVARIRAWAATAAQASWTDTTNFPLHIIAEGLRDAGSPSTLKTQDGLEETTLNYTGQAAVRQSAWN